MLLFYRFLILLNLLAININKATCKRPNFRILTSTFTPIHGNR